MASCRAPTGFRGTWLDDERRYLYCEGAGPFRIVPSAVAVPRDLNDLRKLIDWANSGSRSLIPRGAGSAIPGSNIGQGIVVDLGCFRTPPTFREDSVIEAGAACVLSDIDRVARTRGHRMPVDPSSSRFCTIGGAVSTNAAGPRSYSRGHMRNWVEALNIVTTDGTSGAVFRDTERDTPGIEKIAEFEQTVAPLIRANSELIRARFPQVAKNTAGYALDAYLDTGNPLDILIGSEGTLVFVTSVTIRLEPDPAHSATALLILDSLSQLSEILAALEPVRPASLELLSRSLMRFSRSRLLGEDPPVAALIVEVEGDSASDLEERKANLRSVARGIAVSARIADSAEEVDQIWQVRKSASSNLAKLPSTRRSLQVVEDGCVPVAHLSRYVGGVEELAERHRTEIVAFGHAGDGHLHVNALPDTTESGFEERLSAFKQDVTTLLLSLGGTPSGEHGDGHLRTELLERVYGNQIVDLFARTKRCFDPAGILNPGVKVPDGGHAPPLKVGAGAPGIPPASEAELRRRESEGAWTTWVD